MSSDPSIDFLLDEVWQRALASSDENHRKNQLSEEQAIQRRCANMYAKIHEQISGAKNYERFHFVHLQKCHLFPSFRKTLESNGVKVQIREPWLLSRFVGAATWQPDTRVLELLHD